MKSILITLFLFVGGSLSLSGEESSSSSLIATVQFISDSSAKFQIGTPLSFASKIKNLGVSKSPEGLLWIQFQYPDQLKDRPNSQLFKTEEVEIPSILPGEQLVVNFKATQTLPNLFDYIRNDWAMREYQVILKANDKEYVIGVGNLTFSAYYYEARQRQTPTTIP